MNKTIKYKKFLMLLCKILFATLLLLFLFNYGQLDLKLISIVLHQKFLVISALFFLMLGLLLGGFRWWILLRITDVNVKLLFILKLYLIGGFFSTYLPGAIGGDAVRGLYIYRAQKDARAKVIFSIVVDRIFSLFGLLMVALLLIIFIPSIYMVNEIILDYKSIIISLIFFPILVLLLLFISRETQIVRWVLHNLNKYFEVISITVQCYKKKYYKHYFVVFYQ